MTSPRGDDCRLVIGYGNEKPTNWLYAAIRWFFYWRVDPSESLHRISPSVRFAPNPRRFSSLAFPLGRPVGTNDQSYKALTIAIRLSGMLALRSMRAKSIVTGKSSRSICCRPSAHGTRNDTVVSCNTRVQSIRKRVVG